MRTALEREFLPAALEIVETPAPALPRAVLWAIVGALGFAIVWACLGKIDLVAVAPGKVIAADKTKVIQPVEVGIVKRILVTDGQKVKAGDVLIELDAAATGADTERQREALMAARLEAARNDALARGTSIKAPAGAGKAQVEAEVRAMTTQSQEQRA